MCKAIADNMTKHVRRTLQGHTSEQGLMRWATLENYACRRSMAKNMHVAAAAVGVKTFWAARHHDIQTSH